MNRRTCLGMLLGSTAKAHAQVSPPRPNILFVMTDEHRFDAVGYRNPAVLTPHLNQLAKESVVFHNAYSTSPSCVPARAAIYTGRYPRQCGAPAYITYLPASESTFMAQLQRAGYHTAVIGKQHFGKSTIARGYDEEEIVDAHMPPVRIAPDGPDASSYVRFLYEAGFRKRQELTSAAEGQRFVSRWTADARFHIDSFIGQRAKHWIAERRPKNKPWFLAVSFPGPHQPFDGLGLPQEKRYAAAALDAPHTTAAARAGKPAYFSTLPGADAGLSAEEWRKIRLAYYAKISLIDDQIGEMVAQLKAAGEYDNTLILFTSDHGDFMGEFGLIYKGQQLSEALMRVPMLVKPPVASYVGRREEALVSSFDVAATCLAAAGVAVPRAMAAQDLAPFWRDPEKAPRRTHCFLDAHHVQGVRDGRWKLIHYGGREYGELYDLANDPWEERNLWNEEAVRSIRARLQVQLLDHLIRTGPRAESEWNVGAPRI